MNPNTRRRTRTLGDLLNVDHFSVWKTIGMIIVGASLLAGSTALAGEESRPNGQEEGVYNITSRGMIMTAGGMYFIATGDAKNADITPAKQEKAESSAQYDLNSVQGMASSGKLLIDATGTWRFTGRIGLVMKASNTSRGWNADRSQIIYLPFNKGHSVSVTTLKGATATLAGKTVRAANTATFQLDDGDSTAIEAKIREGNLAVVTVTPALAASAGVPKAFGSAKWAGRSSNGKMWTSIEFETDGKHQTIGPITLVIGLEEERRPLLQAVIRSAAPIQVGGTFTVEPTTDDKFEWKSLSDVAMSGVSWGDMQKPFIRVVRGTLLDARTWRGSIETRFEKVGLEGGNLAEPCLDWTATRSQGLPSDPRSTAPETKKKKTAKSPADLVLDDMLPPFQQDLRGANEIRVKNPNDFKVCAGVRNVYAGKNFDVAAHGQSSVFVPDGRYDIFFVYASKPDALFQGDSFELKGNGVEIKIVKVIGGNYGIRQVK